MFNSKRIIFLIGLLSLVALTGALMVGPAFAKDKGDKVKVDVCHYQEEVTEELSLLDGSVLVKHEHEAWKMLNISESAVKAHVGDDGHDGHADRSGSDFEINNGDFLTDAEITLDTSNDTSECETRAGWYLQVEHVD